MTFTVEAMYEYGVLKPSEPLPLAERQRVELVIRTPLSAAPSPGKRQQALERLLGLGLPVAEWDEMEHEIVRGAVE